MVSERRPVRCAVVAEDRNLADAVVAVIRACGRGAEAVVDVISVTTTSGCRPRRLGYLVEAGAVDADLVVVAADAAGEGHGRGRTISYRRKAQALEDLVPIDLRHKTLVAAAGPCAEAWLLSDPRAFAAGIREGIGVDFVAPTEWPIPQSEREAKQMIGDVASAGTGGDRLARNGFELCVEILGRAELERSANPSLADFSRRAIARLRERRVGP